MVNEFTSENDSFRAQILRLLVKRMDYLRRQEFRDSYYHGQEYIEDRREVPCVITAIAMLAGRITPFDFWLNGGRMSITQRGNTLTIELSKKIPQRLWDELRLIKRGENFIIGYLQACMPTINQKLSVQRYASGNPLVRNFSIMEFFAIKVDCRAETVFLRWPIGMAAFSPVTDVAMRFDQIYIRDYIDACISYFRNDYDECIRKIITSSENFIRTMNWDVKPESKMSQIIKLLRGKKRKTNSFRARLKENLSLNLISGQVINENMQHIYTVRNRIVHDRFRMSTSSSMYCNKSLGTLQYLIQRYCKNREMANYLVNHQGQFFVLARLIGENSDLDEIRKRHSVKRKDMSVVESAEKFEVSMFSSLRFKDKDKKSIR